MFEEIPPKPLTVATEIQLEKLRSEFEEYEEHAPVDPEEGEFHGF